MKKVNISNEANKITNFLKTVFQKTGFAKAMVGMSGGVDSSVVTALLVKALGRENVYPVLLPYKNQSVSQKLALDLIKQLNIPKAHVCQIDISSIVNEFAEKLKCHPCKNRDFKIPGQTVNDQAHVLNQIRLGNIMARARMIILFDFAKKLPGLVVGTENKSEHFLGYFTRFGDSASDIEPIMHLYKTEVFALAKFLHIPDKIIYQPPSANLWQGQTDEGEFGFTYRQADEVIYALYEAKKTKKDLQKQGIGPQTVKKVVGWIEKVSFKHSLPFCLS